LLTAAAFFPGVVTACIKTRQQFTVMDHKW